ncbi:MAG: sulfate transporter CysZ [Thiohalocapsa sp.]
MPSNPSKGAAFMLQGMCLITRPGLKRFVMIPLFINIIVFSGAIWYGAGRFEELMTRMQSAVPDWLSWLEWLLWPIFILALLIIVFYAFTLVANLFASPFNGLLAEKTEALLRGQPLADQGDMKKLLRELPGTLLDEARKILYSLFWSIPFLILAFVVPVVGPAIWFLFTAWMLALQYSDFPMGNHGLKFRNMRATLRRRRFLSIGFGATAAGLTMIPVVNFVVMPAAVAGATAMWVRELSSPD